MVWSSWLGAWSAEYGAWSVEWSRVESRAQTQLYRRVQSYATNATQHNGNEDTNTTTTTTTPTQTHQHNDTAQTRQHNNTNNWSAQIIHARLPYRKQYSKILISHHYSQLQTYTQTNIFPQIGYKCIHHFSIIKLYHFEI